MIALQDRKSLILESLPGEQPFGKDHLCWRNNFYFVEHFMYKNTPNPHSYLISSLLSHFADEEAEAWSSNLPKVTRLVNSRVRI